MGCGRVSGDFLHGPVVKIPPFTAGGVGSIRELRSHIPQGAARKKKKGVLRTELRNQF